MVYRKHTDEKAAQVQSSSIQTTTSQGLVSPSGSQESEHLLDLRKDVAFKAVFSEKKFLIDLLNSILNREDEITDLTYNPTESMPEFVIGKKVIFDLKCTLSTGDIILVEMQFASQDYFRERALYYMARNIDHQLQKKDDEVINALTDEERMEKFQHYRVDPVCGIFILNFMLDDVPRVVRDVGLTDAQDGHRLFTDKFRMLFLELPALEREEDCDTDLKKWLYMIKNSRNMTQETVPFTKEKPIFVQLAEKAKYAALTPQEQDLYDQYRRNEMAYLGSMYKARREAMEEGEARGEARGLAKGEARGRAEGEAKGKRDTARKLKALNIPVSVIAESTGLSEEEISEL